MIRKSISVFMMLIALCGAVALPAGAEETEKTSGDFRYDVREDKTVCISGYLGYTNNTQPETLQIPAEIDGMPVTRLGERAFEPPRRKDVVTVPSRFKSVLIPDTVKEIGEAAFSGCANLTTVQIPDSVTALDAFAFSDCTSLQTVTLPSGITRLEHTFYHCSALRTIQIPKSVRMITSGTFAGCRVKVVLQKGNPYLKLKNDILYNKSGRTLLYAIPRKKALKTLRIPKSVQKIGQGAFADSPMRIEQIILPKGLKKIGQSAFHGARVKNIRIPNGIQTIPESAFVGSQLQTVRIPKSVRRIGAFAFQNTALKTLCLPRSVRRVDQYAFSGCKRLRSVTIGDGIRFGEGAFSGCPKLKSYRIGRRVKLESASDIARKDDGMGTYKGVTFYGRKGTSAEKLAAAVNRDTMLDEPKISFVPLVSLKNATVKGVVDKTYKKAVKKSGAKQRVKVYLKGKALQKGRDYTVTYKHNKARGKATVIVTGLNRYDGVVKRTFQIR